MDLVKKQSLGPMEHAKLYDKYSFLITRQVIFLINRKLGVTIETVLDFNFFLINK